ELAPEIRRLDEKGPELSQRKAKAGAGEDYAWFGIHNESFREDMQGRNVIIRQCRQDGKSYVLAHIKPDKTMLMRRDAQGKRVWQLARAKVGRDGRSGGPAVDFSFDPAGGRIFEDLTRANIGKPLAIVLDDVVYSAPNILVGIRRAGQITGRFTLEETRQLASTMNAGSLAAKLQPEPIREYTIGATMGQENRDRGAHAAVYALIAVAAFMVVYYLFAGVVANVALFMNLILVLGIMAGVSATFTLPGIAGLILIVGMSVDANVLIFERIREEHLQGSSLRMSIRNGYRKVFWTIFDANVTTLITALILYWVGSEQVRGFAITLGYGICMSMFTALFVTRTIFEILVEQGWLKKLPMLRLIKRPNINWMAKRKTFYIISAVLVIGGLGLFVSRSTGLLAADRNLYDIEFAGGTSVWFRMTEPATDGEVRQAIAKAGKEMQDETIATASVYAINPLGQERKSRDFKLDTAQTHTDKVEQAIELAFADKAGPQLQEQKAIAFELLSSEEYPEGFRPVLEEDVLVGSSQVDLKLVDYIGGLKITLDNLDEPQSLEHLHERIRATRLSPDPEFSGGQYRKFAVFGLEKAADTPGTDGEDRYKSVVIAVVDPAYEYSPDKAATWKSEFAQDELRLVKRSLEQASRFQGVTKFNPEVAAEAKVKAGFAIVLALLAIVGYVWVRFGKGRYGLAAIIALGHDVFAVLGLVALATFVYYTPLGRILGISDLKIDMTMIAALLTIIGYSLNDTIVVFDRIRENRGRLADISPTIVNNSINQTMSRTVLTSLTTLLAVSIMYIWGGPGIHGFTSAMILGVLVGTYSSIAIASPTVLLIGRLWQKWVARSEAKAVAAKQVARK
ncbi:MAG: protein translocase subunit SecD, partial [Phycisphaerae bacterium]|nr:protein translocase subunit SecD [Phycisphaerae bacterium]